MINSSRIWPIYSDEHVRYVRVKNNVANITNRQVLIRKVLPHLVEPGLYNIGMYGELKKVTVPAQTLLNYPDVDLLESYFTNLKLLCSLDIPTRNHLIEYARELANKNETMVILRDRIKPQYDEAPCFQYPFNLDTEITINSRYLEIVLMSFKDYPVLHVGRANGAASPLIIGIDWGNTAFIAPFSNHWSTHG